MSQQYAHTDVDNDIINETNREINQMASDMNDLVNMQKAANEMVNQQQEAFDKVEANVDAAQGNLNAGIKDLDEGRALRRGCCGCCGVPACFKPCACGKNNDKCLCTIQ